MDVDIQTQHVDMQPEWRALIEERLARLAERYPKLIRVHVTLKHGRHHLRGAEEVDIVATCAGATLRAAKQEEEMRDAVHAALDTLERELAAHHEERRHFGKAPGPRPSGTIAWAPSSVRTCSTSAGSEASARRSFPSGGGAGTFDGIFLTGILALLLA